MPKDHNNTDTPSLPVKGALVFHSDRGPCVVVETDKENIQDSYPSQPSQNLIELRYLFEDNVLITKNKDPRLVPETRFSQVTTALPSLEKLTEAFEYLKNYNRDGTGKASTIRWKYREDEYKEKIKSNDPVNIAKSLAHIIGHGRGYKFADIPPLAYKPRKIAEECIMLLTQNIMLATGLDDQTAQEHIKALVLGTKPPSVWPRGTKNNLTRKNNLTQEELNTFITGNAPNKTEFRDPAPDYKYPQGLYTKKPAIKETRKPAKTKKPAAKPAPHYPENIKPELKSLYNQERGNVPSNGKLRALFNIAAETLSEQEFEIYVRSDLRMPKKQESFADIAKDMGLRENIVRITRNHAALKVREEFEKRQGEPIKKHHSALEEAPTENHPPVI